MINMSKKLITEFIGTFFLVLTIGLVVIKGVGNPAAVLAIPAVLMAMIYMGGHISGAQYNPAVSLAVLLTGKMSVGEFVKYITVQLIAGFTAAYVVYAVTGTGFGPAPGMGESIGAALTVEILFTFALCLVVLNVAVAKTNSPNPFFGAAIGLVIVAGALAAGGISGGAFNPAVGVGPNIVNAMVNGGSLTNLWIYLVGPLTGAVLAAGVFKMQEGTTSASSSESN